ncbi:hypothetical protein H8356DRAFT_1616777 [Neocallimastix lanati (nom. inval.)]|nr:hypothetical protein H8356DRAFT_1616777 [Neocallimastix sp. JGI-2020a]
MEYYLVLLYVYNYYHLFLCQYRFFVSWNDYSIYHLDFAYLYLLCFFFYFTTY